MSADQHESSDAVVIARRRMEEAIKRLDGGFTAIAIDRLLEALQTLGRSRQRATSTDTSYAWTTILTIHHAAGSEEGAIHQRNQMDKVIAALGGDVCGAVTRPGNAGPASLEVFMHFAEEEDDD